MNKVLKKIQETNILQIFRPFGQYLVFAIFTCDGKSITLVSVLKKTKKNKTNKIQLFYRTNLKIKMKLLKYHFLVSDVNCNLFIDRN